MEPNFRYSNLRIVPDSSVAKFFGLTLSTVNFFRATCCRWVDDDCDATLTLVASGEVTLFFAMTGERVMCSTSGKSILPSDESDETLCSSLYLFRNNKTTGFFCLGDESSWVALIDRDWRADDAATGLSLISIALFVLSDLSPRRFSSVLFSFWFSFLEDSFLSSSACFSLVKFRLLWDRNSVPFEILFKS